MSVRALGVHVWKHGRAIVRSFGKRQYTTHRTARKAPIGEKSQAALNGSSRSRISIQGAVRLFTAGFFRTGANSLAADLRRNATKRLLFGGSGPFLAFIGISVASDTGAVVISEDEQWEAFCFRIRNFMSEVNCNKIKKDHLLDEISNKINEEKEEMLSVSDLELQAPIAKGCSAVVFAARFKGEHSDTDNDTVGYPYALKMMFNYDVQSNSTAIWQAMCREAVPARTAFLWPQHMLSNRKVNVTPHPNVVAMYSVFVDRVPDHLPDGQHFFPAALPARIHPDGAGRNMSLFMLMKRYKCNLKEYLNERKPSVRTSILLLAQLLEGVAHLEQQGVAHRDLKTDNLLLDGESPTVPQLVISDFGCCLADRQRGLRVPYNTTEVDKGGNAALMAPEISTAQPGTFAVLDYSKADLWAVGAIAYEIFGHVNPLYAAETDPSDLRLPGLGNDVPKVIRALVSNLLSVDPSRRLRPSVAANVCQLFLWAPTRWLQADTQLPTNAQILEWLFSLIAKILCEFGLKQDTSSTEYLLIATFLTRIKYVYIKSALQWIHHNV